MKAEADEAQRKQEIAFRRETSFVKLLQSIAVAANEAADIDQAMKVCLDEVCAITGWPVGHVYFVSGEELVPSRLWHLEQQERFAEFREITEQTRFAPGIGLPGRVWSRGQAFWIIDVTRDTNFPRSPAAARAGLHAAFGFPVLIGTEVAAVLEFFAENVIEPDRHLLEVMAQIGTQLGRAVERKRAADALRKAHDELEVRVQERTAQLTGANTLLSEQMERLRRFEEVLRESEEKYRDLVEHSEELIGIHEMDGTILSINPAAALQLGYTSPDELIGRNMIDFLAPDIKTRFGTYLGNLEQGSSRGLMRVITRQGEERIWEFRNSVRTEGVERPLVRAMARDITEQRRAETALRQSEERYRELFKLQTVLYKIAEEASSTSELPELYLAIHKSVSDLINAKNFYIALYDQHTETVTFPYHVDDFDPDWEPRTRIKGLTEYVIRTGKPLLVTPEIFETLLRTGEVEVVISNRIDWIGVPLQNKQGTFGMLGVHSYAGDVRFGQRDVEILTFVSQQVASAIERKQAQEEHSRAEEKFRQVVESAPNSIVMADQSGRIILVNSMTEKLFGYSREDLLKMRIEELIPAHYRRSHEEDRAKFLAGAQARPMGAHRDLYALHKDGAEIPVEIGLNPIRTAQGLFVLAAIVDITERKTIEKDLAERERLSRFGAEVGNALTRGDTLRAKLQQCAHALIRTMGDGIASVWTMQSGNQRLQLEATAGKQASIPSPRNQVAIGQSWIGLVAKDREPLLIDLITATSTKEDQTWAREAGMTSFAGYPLLFEDSLVGVLSVYSARPLTPVALRTMASVADEIAIGIHSASASDALKKSEEKYRYLAERIPAVTYIAEFGDPGRWLYVSPQLESTLGFTPEEWMADPRLYWNQMHPEDRSRILAQEEECRFKRIAFVSEYRMTSRDGNMLWFHDEGTVLDGNLFQGFLLDITERKRIEELKDELTSIVAHELRTPLTSILGSLGYLSARKDQFGEHDKKLLGMAGRNSERMLRLINDLLDIDKIESGKMALDLRPVDLMQTIEHALEANHSYAAQFGVKLVLLETLPGTVVQSEPDRLIQVLTNLISNAVKFSPQDGVVEIRVSDFNGEVRVAVSDRGPGIPEEFRDSLFQKFAQTKPGRAKKGTGLGLSISKAIIEKMGGRIGFETKVGSGTTFFIDLPLDEDK